MTVFQMCGGASGLACGIAPGLARGVAFDRACGSRGVAAGLACGAASVLACGVASGVACGVAFGLAYGVACVGACGVARGVASGRACLASGLASDHPSRIASGVATKMLRAFAVRLCCGDEGWGAGVQTRPSRRPGGRGRWGRGLGLGGGRGLGNRCPRRFECLLLSRCFPPLPLSRLSLLRLQLRS